MQFVRGKGVSSVAKAKSNVAKPAMQKPPVPEAVQRYAITDPHWQGFYETMVATYQFWSDPAKRPG